MLIIQVVAELVIFMVVGWIGDGAIVGATVSTVRAFSASSGVWASCVAVFCFVFFEVTLHEGKETIRSARLLLVINRE